MRWILGLAVAVLAAGEAGAAGRVAIDLSPAGLRNTFRPEQALGAGIDGAWRGGADRLLTPRNVKAMRSADLRPLTYRLRTELGIAAWHWNPAGAWSDPARQQGYWTSSDRLGAPIRNSWGYDLPRRGDTMDQANNTGWSRLDDGDLDTFWKSNPYLDMSYAKAPARPQWFVLELGDAQSIDTAEIAWGQPYATRYRVQYWSGADEYDSAGRWITFPRGDIRDGRGGAIRLSLGASAQPTAFVRVIMDEGSNTAPAASTDARDNMGFAVREAGFGHLGPNGVFIDAVRHAASHDGQSVAHVSSTDPWHRASDRNLDLEQPGLDRVFASGLTNRLPVMVPVGIVYDTPENAAAEIRYLKRRGYPIARVEIGEEPDGQYVDAEDYGALYLQGVDAIRKADAHVPLGGPSLQSGLSDTWLDPDPDRSWNSRFVRYLKGRGRLADLQFFSFEHYPFDDICGDVYGKLAKADDLLSGLMARVAAEGVPTTIPWYISEYGFSAFSGRAESEMPGALLMANIVGQFLSEGGDGAYLFGYGPNYPANQHQPCAGYGNLMLFTADANGEADKGTATLQTARLLTRRWLQPTGPHRLYAAKVEDAPAVKAFPVVRPDGRLALLLINRDAAHAYDLTIDALTGPAEVWRYSADQYEWIDAGPESHPGRNLAPEHATLAGDTALHVLPGSLTVVVGRVKKHVTHNGGR
ncbi:MAG: discoidin domain-containing protein [Alphaproteobacteria bacterium]|nr:discoidin domain-containing protein [Alphaproteobacteria bacterium]MBU1513211.1 discoidin domain-containing protein [Alphaproteobacteria bacterium]MBU2095319.1 discoidin domain-containing protein [Alphaproteobacteria bacterium]MBU2152234.1 discoidin domain-containing protein [Alphaproteobacteria bacterium]MBU2306719.1 discoidin domain-containing protein [Alphaproteobacteria bacterium]